GQSCSQYCCERTLDFLNGLLDVIPADGIAANIYMEGNTGNDRIEVLLRPINTVDNGILLTNVRNMQGGVGDSVSINICNIRQIELPGSIITINQPVPPPVPPTFNITVSNTPPPMGCLNLVAIRDLLLLNSANDLDIDFTNFNINSNINVISIVNGMATFLENNGNDTIFSAYCYINAIIPQ
ncbi:hypothetical protein, partial [Clostridium sp.]|uniref:hypothetical protein n=1 Tax=Clostridium sp. TaxID=1506 RepID=UPI002FCA4A4F